MNIFRFIADSLHLLSFILLLSKIRQTRNCQGISYRTQEINFIVFICRYWDILLYFVSLYNISMKLLYIGFTGYIIYYMRFKRPCCLTYQPSQDDFNHYKFIYPIAFVLTLMIHSDWAAFDFSWSYSIWLEALAILPQLDMIRKSKEVENLTGHYMAALGFYRFFYILNWIYVYFSNGSLLLTSVFGGLLQTVIYCDFLYYYIKTNKLGSTLKILPV